MHYFRSSPTFLSAMESYAGPITRLGTSNCKTGPLSLHYVDEWWSGRGWKTESAQVSTKIHMLSRHWWCWEDIFHLCGAAGVVPDAKLQDGFCGVVYCAMSSTWSTVSTWKRLRHLCTNSYLVFQTRLKRVTYLTVSSDIQWFFPWIPGNTTVCCCVL